MLKTQNIDWAESSKFSILNEIGWIVDLIALFNLQIVPSQDILNLNELFTIFLAPVNILTVIVLVLSYAYLCIVVRMILNMFYRILRLMIMLIYKNNSTRKQTKSIYGQKQYYYSVKSPVNYYSALKCVYYLLL